MGSLNKKQMLFQKFEQEDELVIKAKNELRVKISPWFELSVMLNNVKVMPPSGDPSCCIEHTVLTLPNQQGLPWQLL